MTNKKPTLKLVPNSVPLEAEMIFDSPRTGENRYGTWYAFSVRLLAPYPTMGGEYPAGTEATYFADGPVVAEKLMAYKRGDQFVLTATKAPGQRYMDIDVRPRSAVPAGVGATNGRHSPFADPDDLFGEPEPQAAPHPPATEEATTFPTETYAGAMVAAYGALLRGIEAIAHTHGPEQASPLLSDLNLERVQALATSFMIEAGRQARTTQISRERGR